MKSYCGDLLCKISASDKNFPMNSHKSIYQVWLWALIEHKQMLWETDDRSLMRVKICDHGDILGKVKLFSLYSDSGANQNG